MSGPAPAPPAASGEVAPTAAVCRGAGDLAARPIPAAFRDLVECPRVAALSTVMPDGSPQTSVVWCDTDGHDVRINCMRHFRKTANMAADPRVTLLCYDPRRPLRFLEVRGRVVEMTEEGAPEHLDCLASKYMGRPVRYFGDCIAEAFAATETPVLVRIRPTRVVGLDAQGGHDGGPRCGCPARDRGGSGAVDSPSGTGAARAGGPDQGGPTIPVSHRDLLGAPNHGVLTTLSSDGQPQSSLVWLDLDGDVIRVNTTRERMKGRNLARDPRVSVLVVDPDDTSRYIQVRGVAELVEDGATDHLDELTRRYTSHPGYYGHVYPVEQRGRETRIVCRIHPQRITLDAIHR